MTGVRRNSALIRLGLVATYAVVAFLLAHLVSGHRTGFPTETPGRPEPSDSRNVTLQIDLQASRPVAAWRVSLDGISLAESSRSALTWFTEVSVVVREESRLLLDLTPTDLETDAPLAVRIELNSGPASLSQTLWSPGELVEAVSLEPICVRDAEAP